jgi:hypothetical protein
VDLARDVVAARIANQATLLRRHGDAELAYGLMVADGVWVVIACGLDPDAGFLTRPTATRPHCPQGFRSPQDAPISGAAVRDLKLGSPVV